MSYNFSQFRRGQLDTYSFPLQDNYSLSIIKEQSPLPASKLVEFNNQILILSNKILEHVDDTGTKRKYYYIRYKVYKMMNSTQIITLKLVNASTKNSQELTTIVVDQGYESDYSIFDFVIAPNSAYDQIHFILNRVADDYGIVNDDGSYGRNTKIEIEKLEEVYNVIDFLNTSIGGKGQLKQIGVQGPPGLQMCIDGESIKIGRSGIYEINNGIFVKFIGFIVEPDDRKYFILDYQY